MAARKVLPQRRSVFHCPLLEVLEDRTLLSAYLVTTTADSGYGSLRDALNQINADTSHSLYPNPSNPGVDEIDFAITAASDTGGGYNSVTGIATIAPLSALPPIANAVLIDGYTQTGASPNTLFGVQIPSPGSPPTTQPQGDNAALKIQLDLSAVSASAYGLYVAASNTTIRGLVVNDLNDAANIYNGTFAIFLNGGNDQIQGCFLGTNVSGATTVGGGSGTTGIMVPPAGGIIGGTTPDARNIIAGFGTGIWLNGGAGPGPANLIEGNFIGTDASGTRALGNFQGISVHGAIIVDDLVSGNQTGFGIDSSGVAEGNLIGTDVTGTRALGNGTGIYAGGPSQIGGNSITEPTARNIISGNGVGIFDQSGGAAVVEGNYIGTDVTGTTALVSPASAGIGVLFWVGNDTLGGTAPGDGNVISGNDLGVRIHGDNDNVQGNFIGTDYTGTKPIGNVGGVWGQDAGSNNIIGGTQPGAGNTIAYNNVGVEFVNGDGNAVLGNSIFASGQLGIGLDFGNNNQAAPVLTAAYAPSGATIVTGTITSTPSATFHLEFFANTADDPEGRTFLGSATVTTDASGHGSFTAFLSALPAGQGLVTATATDPSGNTSEFSAGVTATPLPPSSLSGVVWQDFNDDGQVDFGENGISGVTITLTGTDFLGNSVNLSQLTDSDGAYVFANLYPGNYSLTETQPAGYVQGTDSVGTAGGSLAATDRFSVPLDVGVNGLNYNFGEQPSAGGSVQHGQTAGIGFWNNKNGQALIKALNGGATATQLGNWLAATLPHTFGAQAGSNNLAGRSNADIAALFQRDFLLKGVKLDAQLLATALSVYVTSATLDPTQVAAQYGFIVSGDGVGTATVNVGSNGDAFGVANNTVLSLMDLLLATDQQAVNGILYNGNATKRNEANSVYSFVNQAGGIS
jgi:hypothetical protein